MNDKNKTPGAATTAAPLTNPADGLVNLAAKYPLYDGGDARTAKVGTKGQAIHGYLLGTIELPSVILDPVTKQSKAWRGIVIELLSPAPVKEKDGDEEKKRMAVKGERVILTQSKVLEAYSHVADNTHKVFEAYIQPVVGKTKDGQSLWKFPEFRVGRPVQRTEQRMVGTAMFDEPDEATVHPALPAGNVNNATA